MPPRTLRIATRGSTLARWQAETVAARLGGGELVVIETEGDQRSDVPISDMGGHGVFVKEVQQAVVDGRADIAVHSAKDLPAAAELQVPGLALACVPERGDPSDALVGGRLEKLPKGATVATGSARRRLQLSVARPDLVFVGLRGNMETRLAKAAQFDAAVLATVALERLGYRDRIAERLPESVMIPQVGQGALAVECRADDEDALDQLRRIEDPEARVTVDAERAFLARLGGGCSNPIGAHCSRAVDGRLRLTAVLGIEGEAGAAHLHRRTSFGDNPFLLGERTASALLIAAGLEPA